jgi:hypothetical protein
MLLLYKILYFMSKDTGKKHRNDAMVRLLHSFHRFLCSVGATASAVAKLRIAAILHERWIFLTLMSMKHLLLVI